MEKESDLPVNQTPPKTKEKFKLMLKLMRPSLLLLCIASSIRNAAGYVWAYNTQVYFDGLGQTPAQIGSWMSWVPIVGGSIGIVTIRRIFDNSLLGAWMFRGRVWRFHFGSCSTKNGTSWKNLGVGSQSIAFVSICRRSSVSRAAILLHQLNSELYNR